jgi:glycine betaine/choline ABC-type transport system substrate-binding protein
MAGRISEADMREMNYSADALKQNPADIAKRFLERR